MTSRSIVKWKWHILEWLFHYIFHEMGYQTDFAITVFNVVTQNRVVVTLHCTLLSVFDVKCIKWKFESQMRVMKNKIRYSGVYLYHVKDLQKNWHNSFLNSKIMQTIYFKIYCRIPRYWRKTKTETFLGLCHNTAWYSK